MPKTCRTMGSTWPPGTITLEELRRATGDLHEEVEIVLHPKPTNDPNDPLNWKTWEKYLNFGLTLLYSLAIFGLISAATPTWSAMMEELGFTIELLNNGYATGSAALAVGALLFIPFALKYGRRPMYLLSLIGQIAVMIWSAKMQNSADLILTNLFNCLLGALAEVIVQMTVADVFFVHQRGMMNNLYVWCMSIGGSLMPIAAGYITVDQGWRWLWWWLAIILGILLLLFTFLYEETKFMPSINGMPSVVASHDVSEDRKSTDHKPLDLEPIDSIFTTVPPLRMSYLRRLIPWTTSEGSMLQLLHHTYQPFLIMATIPAVLYVALLYGLVTAAFQVSVTLVSTYLPVPPYNFNASQVGLMSIPALVGNTLGTIVSAPFADRLILWLARKNNGIYEPEMRLWLLLAFAPFFPAGLIMFGYAIGLGMSWPIVAVGIGMFSFAMPPMCSIIADAVVGVTFTRNFISTIFVFALTPWVTRVGVHNVMLTFALITVISLASTGLFIKFGKQWRIKTVRRYRTFAERQMDTRDKL
ncbi:synaptic vesicle transporter [Macroventuria anomochaeta]|uniref:Synaptic vesicle transporter n=1 Tax=Macroventuria anomochaeta TaxID=301207 RepID=A0ACB6S6N7_9PLEO|nr:synaptic vesicle transporter [Macroventuria anomochaeta]KAF2629703.1 synaptic vesicle transporter [Macroventuria anomochaeta]